MRLFLLRDYIDLFEIHFDFVDNNNKIKVFNSNNIKVAFINVEIKFNLLKKF